MKNKWILIFICLCCVSDLFVWIIQANATTWKVTTTADGGSGSLRAAISQANLNTGTDNIEFDIPDTDPGFNPATGIYTIQLATNLSVVFDPVVIDGTTQPGFLKTPVIELTGTAIPPPSRGLDITGGGTTVRGLVINGFKEDGLTGGQGISISGIGGNIIEGNFIGVDATGTRAVGNSNAIQIDDSPDNRIGGTIEKNRNLISGNRAVAIAIRGGKASGNIVQGNYIGTDITGTVALGNGIPISNIGGIGITGPDNLIGGSISGAGNLISGNGKGGIAIAEATATGNQVLGNFIGVDVSGTQALPNDGIGVRISDNAKNNLIGGSTAMAGNIISGNAEQGIAISSQADSNQVSGNFIGTDITGTLAVPNQQEGVWIIDGASKNNIGGSSVAARNIISGNANHGVSIGTDATGNYVLGNYIGTDVTGSTGLGNGYYGLYVYDSDNNEIGGTSSIFERNIISGNGLGGVGIFGSLSKGNSIEANFIGTDHTGSKAVPNMDSGVMISTNACENQIGGSIAAARNIISGNKMDGILIRNQAINNVVTGNFIGVDVSGATGLSNGKTGIEINSEANDNQIGGFVDGQRNIIAANIKYGILINAANQNVVQGNYIGVDATGIRSLGNGYNGICLLNGSQNTIGGVMKGGGNTISGNHREGIYIASNSMLNTVQGNLIGTDVTGMAAIGNSNGITVSASSNNMIGGTIPGAGNLISGNRSMGMLITSSGPGISGASIANKLQGNFIGTDILGTDPLGNGTSGIVIGGGTTTTVIGGTDPSAGNIIAFNRDRGIQMISEVSKPSNGNSILGNQIYGNTSLGIDHSRDGVTPNDLQDADTGANQLQNFPELILATSNPASTTIKGKLNSSPNMVFRLEFFDNSQRDFSDYGEGENFLGAASKSTNNQGDVAFEITFFVSIPSGHYITATATDPAGNTSEFSRYVTVNDSDGDGLSDAFENKACTDVNNPDTDGDGISDGVEDWNHNGLMDPDETNPCEKDSDGDNWMDGQEDSNHNGILDVGESDPGDANSMPFPRGDYNTDGKVDIKDAVICLQILTRMATPDYHIETDTNGDKIIEYSDLIYILKKTKVNLN
ncbi:MAG: hypothetical protein ABIJ31_05495 [Pseudomonadota bacterium]